MLFLLMFLMAYSKTGRTVHEVLGIIMFVCFIFHHIFNLQWYKTVFKGKYMSNKMMIYIIINILLLFDVLFLIMSGLSMSKIIPFISIIPISLARRIHMVLSYWGFILIAVHLALHIKSFILPIKNKLSECTWLNKKIIQNFIFYSLVFIGVIMFIKSHFISYLFMTTEFVFFDDMSLIQFILEYFTIFILFVYLSYMILKWIINKKRSKKFIN